MRTIESQHPAQSSTTDRDFHLPAVNPLSGDLRLKEQAYSLFEAFADIEASKTEAIAMKIIDRMKLSKDDSTILYFYHLWHEDPQRAFIRIKKLVGEIREDEIGRIRNKVGDNDLLVKQYDKFYKRYIRATERQRRQGLVLSLEENVPLEEAAQEAEIKLSNAYIIKEQLDKKAKEITLEESLKEKELSPKETRTMQAVDVLNISLPDKKILFGAYLFFGIGGVFRVQEVLGLTVNQAVAARDRVRTNERYEDLWKKLEFLMKPNVLEFVFLKKRKLSFKEISEMLGISPYEVGKISKDTVSAEVLEPSSRGKHNADRFRKICDDVFEANARGIINYDEIASICNISRATAKRAVLRLSRAGRLKTLTKHESGEMQRARRDKLRQKIIKYRDEHLDYTIEQLAEALGETIETIRNQISIAIEMGILLPKKEAQRRRMVNQSIIFEANPV